MGGVRCWIRRIVECRLTGRENHSNQGLRVKPVPASLTGKANEPAPADLHHAARELGSRQLERGDRLAVEAHPSAVDKPAGLGARGDAEVLDEQSRQVDDVVVGDWHLGNLRRQLAAAHAVAEAPIARQKSLSHEGRTVKSRLRMEAGPRGVPSPETIPRAVADAVE